MQGKTHQQISLEMGLPLGTVKSRVRIGLKKMQLLVGVASKKVTETIPGGGQ
jgi:DNA-directed RNA polymerase specialized sigma24 family protein